MRSSAKDSSAKVEERQGLDKEVVLLSRNGYGLSNDKGEEDWLYISIASWARRSGRSGLLCDHTHPHIKHKTQNTEHRTPNTEL
jgi:hypothetical protein